MAMGKPRNPQDWDYANNRPFPQAVEQDRLDILTGRDEVKRGVDLANLGPCKHCGSRADIHFMLGKPYAACRNSECGATTGSADTVHQAAGKWNRSDG